MNDHRSPGPDEAPELLPEPSPEALARMEEAVLTAVARQPRHPHATKTSAPRRRRWLTGVGVAAAFVAGVLITPPLLATVGAGRPVALNAVDAPMATVPSLPEGVTAVSPESISLSAESMALDGSVSHTGADLSVPGRAAAAEQGREIVSNASAAVRVADIAEAAAAITQLAEDSGGYVESTNLGTSLMAIDAEVPGTVLPVPPQNDHGWIGIRVPADQLTDVVARLEQTGSVLSTSVSRQDVTATAIDLRARVEATRTSVARLTELMAQSASVSELIEAEVALTDRQAQLEAFEQQLAALDDQVAMSTLQVELTRDAAPTAADPGGFGSGVLAGWNGLIVSLNALVIALGFLLPWLAVAAVIGLVVWGIRRGRRRNRRRGVGVADR